MSAGLGRPGEGVGGWGETGRISRHLSAHGSCMCAFVTSSSMSTASALEH